MRFTRRSCHAALLALALLAAQALGLAHRTAHGLPQPAGSAPAAAGEVDGAPFSAHEPGGTECRLFDQASHADALANAPSPALPPRVPAPMPAVAGPCTGAAAIRAYFARGPPAAGRTARQTARA